MPSNDVAIAIDIEEDDTFMVDRDEKEQELARIFAEAKSMSMDFPDISSDETIMGDTFIVGKDEDEQELARIFREATSMSMDFPDISSDDFTMQAMFLTENEIVEDEDCEETSVTVTAIKGKRINSASTSVSCHYFTIALPFKRVA